MGNVQDFCAYHPGKRDLSKNSQGKVSPQEYGLNFEELYLDSSSDDKKKPVKLHTWVIKQDRPLECPTILFFHGIGGSIGTKLPQFNYLYKKCKVNIVAVEYRGYGRSTGKPSETGIKQDMKAVSEFIKNNNNINPETVFIHGVSFGGAVTIYLTSIATFKPAGIIVGNTFTRMDAVVAHKSFKFIGDWWSNKWISIEIMPNIECPIMVMTGLKDKLIPPQHSVDLYNAATKAAFRRKIDFPEAEHKGLWVADLPLYINSVNQFISDCMELIKKDQIKNIEADQIVIKNNQLIGERD